MLKHYRVLLVDDEERILNFLRTKLKNTGYEVLTARDGAEALESMQAQEPDMVVLDLVMPKMDGFDVLKEIRRFSSVPVIILSARGTNNDKVKGLSFGADDYLAKPFSPDELLARIAAVRRRMEPTERSTKSKTLSLGDIQFDFVQHHVTIKGQEKYFTPIEWLLLSELAQNAGRIMLYEDLLTRVWGPEYRDDVQLLRTWISRLRAKIEKEPDNPRIIRNIPKTGYTIDQPAV